MANWTGVITNTGSNILNEWVNEKKLTFDRAAAGQGTVSAVALLAQTNLVNQKQEASLIHGEKTSEGIRLKIRITAHETGYILNQYGIWASVDGEESGMIALFQNDKGIDIPSKEETPDFSYTFYALITISNIGQWEVNVDASVVVTQDMIGRPNGVAGLGPDGKVPEEQLPDMTVDLSGDKAAGILPLAKGGTGASAAQGARTNLEVAKPVRTTVSFPTSGWALSGSVYTQTVSCSVAKATMKYANIGPQYSTDASARKLEQEAYALIAYVDTADGQLVATCWGNEKPAVNLTLIFEGGAD